MLLDMLLYFEGVGDEQGVLFCKQLLKRELLQKTHAASLSVERVTRSNALANAKRLGVGLGTVYTPYCEEGSEEMLRAFLAGGDVVGY